MNKRMICNSKVNKSKVNGMAWKSESEFITFGAKHLKVWTMNGTNLTSANGSHGSGTFIP